eukprot:907253-Pelagomonas_calceolata.AAC.1
MLSSDAQPHHKSHTPHLQQPNNTEARPALARPHSSGMQALLTAQNNLNNSSEQPQPEQQQPQRQLRTTSTTCQQHH